MVMTNYGNPKLKTRNLNVELFAHDRPALATKIQQEELLTTGSVTRGWYGFSLV